MTVFDVMQWSPLHLLVPLILLQRLAEVRIAKRNEAAARQRGGIEFGRDHYPAIITLHTLWFVGMIAEVIYLSRPVNPFWPGLLAIVVLCQGVRYWTIRSLGPNWNTRVIVVPGTTATTHGPYRYLRHPNYVVVAVELLLFPMIFGAYLTAITATIINTVLLRIRIRTEEKAWREVGKGYEEVGKGG